MKKLIKRISFAILSSVGMFLFSMLITIPMTYSMNYIMPLDGLVNPSNMELIVYAARLSAVLMIPPLIIYSHSMLPDHARLETDVVLNTMSSLLNDGVFLLLVGSVILSWYLF